MRSIFIVAIGGLAGLVILFGLMQLVPYGHDHANPPVIAEPKWDSPTTRALVVRACFDCHSNQTVWPWYSNVAPISWLIERDVVRGRERLNFSEWTSSADEARRSARDVQSGRMPQWYYLLLHPSANLTPAEQQQLILGLQATFGSGGGEGGGEG